MLRLAATVHTLTLITLTATRARLTRAGGERGSVTLEQVLMSLGLFLLAVGVVAGITAVVNGRLAQIT